MGKSRTSKYALEIFAPGLYMTPMCWWVGKEPGGRFPGHGRPTAENLTKWVVAHHKSLEPGGSNAHLSDRPGGIPYLTRARIVTNDRERRVVAEWTAPMFMLVGPSA